MSKKITRKGHELTPVHINVEDFSKNLVESYIHTLFDQVQKEHGIRQDFMAYNGELLMSLAKAIAVILTGIEEDSIGGADINKMKDGFIELLNDYYNYKIKEL